MSGRGECEEPASTAIEDADDDNGRPCGSRNGGAVGKQPDGDEAPEAARAMHRKSIDDVVDEHPCNGARGEAVEDPADSSDDDGHPVTHDGRTRRDRDEPGEQAIACMNGLCTVKLYQGAVEGMSRAVTCSLEALDLGEQTEPQKCSFYMRPRGSRSG